MICAALALGLNLGTYHFDRESHFREFNPGIYAVCDDLAAGVYLNSQSHASIHAGKVFKLGPVDIEVGLVTGYQSAPVLPLVIPSMRFGSVRIGLIPPVHPKVKGGLTFSAEF